VTRSTKDEENIALALLIGVPLLFLVVGISVAVGEYIGTTKMRCQAINSGCGYYDQRTGEFKFHAVERVGER
jgi:hypothetical protein